jgi:TRAP-type C4-dicarboxylate transport system substrate-binding protein
VTKYAIDVDLGHDLFFIAMNQNTFNKLSPDAQKVFDKLSGDWAVDFTGKEWDKFELNAENQAKAKGIEYISLSPQEIARWRKLLAPIQEEYAGDLESKKLPGKKILEELKKFGAKK